MHIWILVLSHIAVFAAGAVLAMVYGASVIKELKADLAKAQADVANLRGQAGAFIGGAKK